MQRCGNPTTEIDRFNDLYELLVKEYKGTELEIQKYLNLPGNGHVRKSSKSKEALSPIDTTSQIQSNFDKNFKEVDSAEEIKKKKTSKEEKKVLNNFLEVKSAGLRKFGLSKRSLLVH
mmetsp:Transcript_34368/g.33567  ORF Transcript_34368/g.33567 Transcript_34368/m.33567 type:complete len:118 (-) Transcript_34368:241-594(-)